MITLEESITPLLVNNRSVGRSVFLSICLSISLSHTLSLFDWLSVCYRSVVFLSCRSVTVCTKCEGNGGEDAESESGSRRLSTQGRSTGLMNVDLKTRAESRGLRAGGKYILFKPEPLAPNVKDYQLIVYVYALSPLHCSPVDRPL